MAATRKDVAKIADVSEATVSYVINNTKNVSPATRQKVLDAAASLNYHPNLIARSLTTKETRHIALLVDNIQNPHYGTIMKGVQQVAEKEGYIVSVLSTNYSSKDAMSELVSRGVDGVIFMLGSFRDSDFPDLGIPAVSEGGAILTDYRQAVFDMVKEFKKEGHRRIAFLSGLRLDTVHHDRYNFFMEALKYYGLEQDENLIVEGKGYTDEKAGYEAADILLKRTRDFTGIFAVNDLMAIGAMKRLWEAGLTIPRDVSLVGCDGIVLAEYMSPPLSTIQTYSFNLGKALVYELLSRIYPDRTFPSSEQIIHADFIRRESLGPARNCREAQPHCTDQAAETVHLQSEP